MATEQSNVKNGSTAGVTGRSTGRTEDAYWRGWREWKLTNPYLTSPDWDLFEEGRADARREKYE